MTIPRPYEIIKYNQLEKREREKCCLKPTLSPLLLFTLSAPANFATTPKKREKHMTRKDYQLIAEVLKKTAVCNETGAAWPTSLEARALNFAQELKKDNPNFKPALFLKACGI